MREESLNLLRRAFKRFYFKNGSIMVRKIEQREFGYMHFNSGMIRHLSFKNADELRAMMLKEVPSDVYCSNAYYLDPTAEIEEKGFLAADLIFDIDIKELPLECMREHQAYICNECKAISQTQICIKCKSTRVIPANLPCNECINSGKNEVRKLIEILNELGIERDIEVYFSGNNGFHIHVYNDEFSTLDSNARAEIADYINGNNLIIESLGINKGMKSELVSKKIDPQSYGWKGRIVRRLIDGKKKEDLAHEIISKYDKFRMEIPTIARGLGARIDPMVTMDIHRIFRLQGTLNSKSGLAKVPCNDLENFDPFRDASLLDDEEVSIHVYYSPKFRLKENYFGPFKESDTKLPLYAAVYLICKGLADAT